MVVRKMRTGTCADRSATFASGIKSHTNALPHHADASIHAVTPAVGTGDETSVNRIAAGPCDGIAVPDGAALDIAGTGTREIVPVGAA